MGEFTSGEIDEIISKEGHIFKKKIARNIFAKKMVNVAVKVAAKLDRSFENDATQKAYLSHFKSNVMTNLNPRLANFLDNGGVGNTYAEEMACMINKYVSQEMYHRANQLKKKIMDPASGEEKHGLTREGVIKDIRAAFEDDENLNLTLSENLNEEEKDIHEEEKGDIIQDAANTTQQYIDDAEEKSEVTKDVMSEFKSVQDKVDEQKGGLDSDDANADSDAMAGAEGETDGAGIGGAPSSDPTAAAGGDPMAAGDASADPNAAAPAADPTAAAPAPAPAPDPNAAAAAPPAAPAPAQTPAPPVAPAPAPAPAPAAAPAPALAPTQPVAPAPPAQPLTGSVANQPVAQPVTMEHEQMVSLVKKFIPVSASRFALELEAHKDKFKSTKLFTDLLCAVENGGANFDDAVKFIDQRIDRVQKENQDVKAFDPSEADDFRDLFGKATSDIKETIKAINMIGFGMGNLPAGKKDPETLTAIKKLAEYKRESDAGSATYNDIIAEVAPKEITSTEEYFDVAIDLLALKSNKDMSRVGDYEQYRKAIEVRDELIGEFLIDGMKHVPEAKLKRLNEINNGLNKLAAVDGVKYLNADNLNAVYYKTAKVVDPGVFVDFDKERERIKELVQENYNTDKYDIVVDAFFDPTVRNKLVATENYFEAFLTKYAIENMKDRKTDDKDAIKKMATSSASYFTALEKLGCVSHDDITYSLRKEMVGV